MALKICIGQLLVNNLVIMKAEDYSPAFFILLVMESF